MFKFLHVPTFVSFHGTLCSFFFFLSFLSFVIDHSNLYDVTKAITCRVAPSFLRVGHIELFSRRARRDGVNQSRGSGIDGIEITTDLQHLEMICEHMREREYNHIAAGDYCTMLRHASKKFAQLTTNWIRVGYCQGADFVLVWVLVSCFLFLFLFLDADSFFFFLNC